MSFFGFVLSSKLDVAFILPQNAKTQLSFLSRCDFFHLHTGSSTHWWPFQFLGSTPVFGHKEPDQNIPRKESHRLAIPLTLQSAWLGCLSKSNYSINMPLKSFAPLGKKTTQIEEWASSNQTNLTLKAWLRKISHMPVAPYYRIRGSAHPYSLIFHRIKSSFEPGLIIYKTTARLNLKISIT